MQLNAAYAMNTRRGRGRPAATASSSSSTVKSNPPAVRPRGNRRNGLHNITNTKSDETDAIVDEPISLDSADEGEQESVADQQSTTEKPTNKRLKSPASVPETPAKKKRRSKSEVDAVSTELALYNSICETLSKHYFDVVTRLQLNVRIAEINIIVTYYQ